MDRSLPAPSTTVQRVPSIAPTTAHPIAQPAGQPTLLATTTPAFTAPVSTATASTASLPVAPLPALAAPQTQPVSAPQPVPAPQATSAPLLLPTIEPSPTPASAPTSNNTPTTTVPANTQALKRFRFTDALDILLLKAVNSAGAHLAGWGQTQPLFEKALNIFVNATNADVFLRHNKPSHKSLSDRFKRLAQERRDDVKSKTAASGIIEVFREKETLLDDMILEMDEKDEREKVARDERIAQEKRLLEAGEEIREQALRRRTADTPESDSNGPSTRRRASRSPSMARRRVDDDTDDMELKIVLEDMDKRREIEQQRLDLERGRDRREQEEFEREGVRYAREQENVARRLALDESRAAVEMEERREAIKERKCMAEALAALARKIQ